MKTADLISELATLPVEDRVQIADSILKTLNSTQPDIDQAWVKVAQERLADIHAGRVQTIPAMQVLESINQRLGA